MPAVFVERRTANHPAAQRLQFRFGFRVKRNDSRLPSPFRPPRVMRPGGRLMLIDGYRDAPWGWFIDDVCVAGVEDDVHRASARRFREPFAQAGPTAVAQKVHRGREMAARLED